MLLRIAWFELRTQLRQPLFWVTGGAFALGAFVATVTDALQLGGAIGSLNRNAPYVVVRMLGNMSVLGAFMTVAFVASSVLRDFEHGTHELLFSRPLRARDLLLGRFLGSTAATCLGFSLAAVGLLLGSLMPWLEPERVGPFDLRPHAFGLLAIAFPSFVVLGGLFFALASRVRSMIACYVALVALLVGYFVAGAMLTDVASQEAAAFLDPFGLAAFDLQTQYWTIAEKNSLTPSFAGRLLWSRLAWLALAAIALAWGVASFRYEAAVSRRRRRPAPAEAASVAAVHWQRWQPAFTRRTPWRQLLSRFRLEARFVLRSVPFLLILAFSLVNVIANMGYLDLMFGTPVWPVTYLMLLAVRAGYSFLLIVVVTFYAGEGVWRERGRKLDGIVDATPAPIGVLLGAKVLALGAAAFVFIAAGMLGLIGYQLSQGYTRIQLGLYAQGLLVETLPFLLAAVLALFLQVALHHKFLAYLVMVLYLIASGVLSALHFDHNLYRYGSVPSGQYSDLNGWGHFVAPIFWFGLYWSLAAGLLLVLAYAFWVRGSDTALRLRLAQARARLAGGVRGAALGLVAAFVLTGGFIYWNTNIRNEYVPSDEAERRLAAYEKSYRPYRSLPQPRVTKVQADVDIFPRERRALIRGTYRLVNRSDAPIPSLHLTISPRLKTRRLELPPHRIALQDRKLGYAIYDLLTPLAPGAETTLGFELAIENPGFVNAGADTTVVENGSLITSRYNFPALGYVEDRELEDPAQRRRHGLPATRRMDAMDDPAARRNNDLASDADWIELETTVSTDPDQTALCSGDLEREWTDGGRRYFHYKMRAPIARMFAYVSGRYRVRRDAWRDVAIEVYHHPAHEYNVGRMVDAVKKTLAYLTDSLAPYPHRVLRIVEFPRYGRYAVSFPDTIPFSESAGFIARLRDPDDIDYPFYVTAHEVAHQWWGHQVLGANVQGAPMLSETLAQYSALMVMEKEYGSAKMRRFLRYELDQYLSGRGGELAEENPLERVEIQPYIYYRKGSLVMYALKDAIGEERLNAALKRYVSQVRFQGPPYTVSRELLAHVEEATPPERRGLLEDLFRSITLFDNEAVRAEARRLPDGKYELRLEATSRKLRADGKGHETEAPLDDWIDVGVFGAKAGGDEPALYLRKHHVTSKDLRLTVVVDAPPVRAGIDPYNKLIDRTPGDNVRRVTAVASAAPATPGP